MSTSIVARDGVRVPMCPRASCSQCGSRLVLHQPEPVRPQRLLGTCPECHRWFLVLGRDARLVEIVG